jgi:hypothetical protein
MALAVAAELEKAGPKGDPAFEGFNRMIVSFSLSS